MQRLVTPDLHETLLKHPKSAFQMCDDPAQKVLYSSINSGRVSVRKKCSCFFLSHFLKTVSLCSS